MSQRSSAFRNVHTICHNLHFEWNQKQYHSYRAVLPLVKDCLSQEIYMSSISSPQVIKNISHIKFANLTLLDVSHNSITTLEPLILLQAPMLEYLRIGVNYLTTVKSLRKCNFPNLKRFRISDNMLVDVCDITLFNFKSLEELDISHFKTPKNNCFQNISFLSKLDCNLTYINIRRNNSIKQFVIAAKITQKFARDSTHNLSFYDVEQQSSHSDISQQRIYDQDLQYTSEMTSYSEDNHNSQRKQ